MARKKLELGFSLLIVLLLAWAMWEAQAWPLRTRMFPLAIGLPVLGIALLQLAVATWGLRRRQPAAPLASLEAGASGALGHERGLAAAAEAPGGLSYAGEARRRAVAIVAWTVAFALGLWLLGFKVGSPLLSFAFLRFAARESTRTSATIAVATYLFFLLVFELALNVPFSPGLIAQSLGLQSFDWYLVTPLLQALKGR